MPFWRKDQNRLAKGFQPNAKVSILKMKKDLKRLKKGQPNAALLDLAPKMIPFISM